MKKFLAIIITVYLSFIIFMPKEYLIYIGLSKLKSEKLYFKINQFHDYGLFAKIDNMICYYDRSRVVDISSIKIVPLIFFNKIYLMDTKLSKSFRIMLNVIIKEGSISQNILKPFIISIYANTSIGKLEGIIDLKSKKLKIVLTPNNEFKNFKYKNYLKKTKEGYLYESNLKF